MPDLNVKISTSSVIDIVYAGWLQEPKNVINVIYLALCTGSRSYCFVFIRKQPCLYSISLVYLE